MFVCGCAWLLQNYFDSVGEIFVFLSGLSVEDYCGVCMVLDLIENGFIVLVDFVEVHFGMSISCWSSCVYLLFFNHCASSCV